MTVPVDPMPPADAPRSATCDLCEAARITEWFFEDDLCWIAECEICATPMVVLRWHERDPDPAVKGALRDRLATVVTEHFTFDHYVDDHMRNIPDHYHAHARPIGGFFGHGLRRREP
ncbi:MAG: hypothetical protein HYX34_05240 [Actinobacteria bacterium]|nr:hypothetical protein [Actinomycetota bacterium]